MRLIIWAAALAALLIAALWATMALSHGDADWIARGMFRSPQDGSVCCGEHDCVRVEPVRITPTGYFLPAYNETVPQSEAHPSKDGSYWRCKRPDGSRRCFFAPPPSS